MDYLDWGALQKLRNFYDKLADSTAGVAPNTYPKAILYYTYLFGVVQRTVVVTSDFN